MYFDDATIFYKNRLTKKVGDGKTHARVVSDQRPKVGGRGGKGAAGPSSVSE